MPFRNDLPHLYLPPAVDRVDFTPVTNVPIEQQPLTARQQRYLHANKLTEELDNAAKQRIEIIQSLQISDEDLSKGVCLSVEGSTEHPLDIDALENRSSRNFPIELLNVRIGKAGRSATIFVPESRFDSLKKKIGKYADESIDPSGSRASTLSIDSIEAFKLADLDSFWMDNSVLPTDKTMPYVWETWLRKGYAELLRTKQKNLGITVSAHSLNFQECEICLLTAPLNTLAILQMVSAPLLAFRFREAAPSFFTSLTPQEQAGWAENLAERLESAPAEAAAVCVLDTGIRSSNKLLVASLADKDCDTYDPTWGSDDSHGHGTEVAGLALMGDLVPLLAGSDKLTLKHRLESVKILPATGENPQELYGWITQECASRAEVNAPQRKRIFCLAVTNPGNHTNGRPTAWSAAIDKLCIGVGSDFSIDDKNKRLFVIAVGNIRDDLKHAEYSTRNDLESVESPSQSWNALSVGGTTFKSFTEDKKLDGWDLLAGPGDISPTSRTSVIWDDKDWPIKPDIVLEAGNCITDGSMVSKDADLALLTTARDVPLTYTCETSAAAAQAARMAVILQAEYPDFWPETIRGLLVHSARWQPGMFRGKKIDQMLAADKEALLRRFGYGMPDLGIAQFSASNRACLISQNHIQPFTRGDDDTHAGYKDMNIHTLPWPSDLLNENPTLKVWLRVTLSYFIEPNPAERLPSQKYSYASHRLKFDLQRPLETPETLRQRVNKKERLPGVKFQPVDTSNKWQLGTNARNKGSVVSDVWTGIAADLAAQNTIVVMPEAGWWKYRKHLKRGSEKTRYALIVTLEAEGQKIDIYTKIASIITTPTTIVT
jgi:hypothetical protein